MEIDKRNRPGPHLWHQQFKFDVHLWDHLLVKIGSQINSRFGPWPWAQFVEYHFKSKLI